MEKRPTYQELEQQLHIANKKAAKAEELKNAFLSNISHEIRTPMNAIVGASELLCDNSLSKEDRGEFTQILKSSSKELLDLFNRILELSQLETGVLQYIESEVEVYSLLVKLYSVFNQKINESKKKLTLTFTDGLQGIKLYTDLEKITKVLYYLLENAVIFTEKGEIDFGCTIQSKHTVLFYVKDTGSGICKAEQKKIFNKFTQVDNSYTRAYSGAGLGLSLCKETVSFLGGDLYIDSNPGQGSIFYFTVPLKIKESNTILKDKIETISKRNINNLYSARNVKKDIAI